MNKFQSLYLSRQFILAPEKINLKFDSVIQLLPNGYTLYAHKNLPVEYYSIKQNFIIVIGNIFSSLDTNATNKSIAEKFLSFPIDSLLKDEIRFYSGRYAIIIKKDKEFICFNDASAHRKVYFTNHLKQIWCASQPHVLAELLSIKISKDKETKDFFSSNDFLKRELCGILDTTQYDEIRQLSPGKSLNLQTNEPSRFWPSKLVTEKSLDNVLKESSILLENVIKNAANRYPLMLPITAGRDSRLLLAATKKIKDKIYYYTNKNKYEKQDNSDISIPKKIFKKIKTPHNVECYDTDSPKDFGDIIEKNITFPYDKYNSLLYHVYFKKHPKKLNIPGICGEISYKWANKKLPQYSGKELAKFFNFKNNKYVEHVYDKWLNEALEICKKTNIPPLSLFFWEEIISNWAINVSQMKDIAQDEFYPMNFTAFQELLFSVDIKYRDYHSNLVFKKLVQYMWPEISKFSYNPCIKSDILRILKKFNLYFIAQKIVLTMKGIM